MHRRVEWRALIFKLGHHLVSLRVSLRVNTAYVILQLMKSTAIAFKAITPFLKTKNLAETVRFYVDNLGFVVDSQWAGR